MLKVNLKRSACAMTLALATSFAVLAPAVPAQADGVLNGETIRIIAVSDPVFKSMQKMHDEMEKMAGGKIELNVLPFDTLHQQVLLNSQSSESRYDIIAIDLPQFGEYQGFLTDLSAEAANIDKSDFQAAAWEGVVHGGKVLAIPIQPHPEIFAYRTDLFQQAGITSPPKTTDDVVADAQKLHHPDKNVAGIRPGRDCPDQEG
jgi:multiple sugar transport system substrate-binding protein